MDKKSYIRMCLCNILSSTNSCEVVQMQKVFRCTFRLRNKKFVRIVSLPSNFFGKEVKSSADVAVKISKRGRICKLKACCSVGCKCKAYEAASRPCVQQRAKAPVGNNEGSSISPFDLADNRQQELYVEDDPLYSWGKDDSPVATPPASPLSPVLEQQHDTVDNAHWHASLPVSPVCEMDMGCEINSIIQAELDEALFPATPQNHASLDDEERFIPVSTPLSEDEDPWNDF